MKIQKVVHRSDSWQTYHIRFNHLDLEVQDQNTCSLLCVCVCVCECKCYCATGCRLRSDTRLGKDQSFGKEKKKNSSASIRYRTRIIPSSSPKSIPKYSPYIDRATCHISFSWSSLVYSPFNFNSKHPLRSTAFNFFLFMYQITVLNLIIHLKVANVLPHGPISHHATNSTVPNPLKELISAHKVAQFSVHQRSTSSPLQACCNRLNFVSF